ncbi:MAG: phosphoribosylglycinamide formyltransferase [Candidatus Niyogibacteria bacterium]|nr:phosphoribosylglycinamide formyltransferase [Candidatus Niyogibacteria bacterium]
MTGKIKKRVIVFASGTATGGGSGFENLVAAMRAGRLNANIVAVVSSHAGGGVHARAIKLGVPFVFMREAKQAGAQDYQRIAKDTRADFVFLSGWLHRTQGLDPRTTINIHPAPLPDFGGKGMYGHHAHAAVLAAYHAGKVKMSAVSMHFVTDEYDRGPVFFQCPVAILSGDTPETLAKRVNDAEHQWQPYVSDLVVQGKILWDGKHPHTLRVPADYRFHTPFDQQ